jgi:adenine-specific DNA methylase
MGKRTETFLMQKRKLIEVALPLEAINRESAREKCLRHGHPSTLHLWWARRPLAAARAVLFAQLVHDPSSHPEKFPTEEAQKAERSVSTTHRGTGQVGEHPRREAPGAGAPGNPRFD